MGPRKRTLVLINTCLFCILAFVFNLVVFSLERGQSVISLFNEKIWQDFTLQLIGVFFTITLIYRVKKFSLISYVVFISTVLFSTINIFLDSFDKVILGLNFIFAVIAYYYYLLLKSELAEPYYNPNYHEGQISSYSNKELTIKVDDNNGNVSGVLTNWGESGFFCRVNKSKPIGNVRFSLEFKGKEFKGKGFVVYHSKTGVGVIINSKNTVNLGWPHFYGIMDEFGIRPDTKAL